MKMKKIGSLLLGLFSGMTVSGAYGHELMEHQAGSNQPASLAGTYLITQVQVTHLGRQSATSATLPTLGIPVLHQPTTRWVGSGVGGGWLSSQRRSWAHGLAAWSDQEQRFMVDEALLGYQTRGKWPMQVEVGRFDPLSSMHVIQSLLPDVWAQALLGDDHWHADGGRLTTASKNWQGQLTLMTPSSYRGAQRPFYSTNVRWQSRLPLQIQAWVGWSPQVARRIDFSAAHSHARPDLSQCGVLLGCFRGRSVLGIVQVSGQGPQVRWAFTPFIRHEQGQVIDPLGQPLYRGYLVDVNGSIEKEQGVGLPKPVRLGLAGDALVFRHRVAGPNSELVAYRTGLLPNRSVPWRVELQAGYLIVPSVELTVGGLYDHTGLNPEAVLGLAIRHRALWY